ncbi:MAG: RIP metalloprotease RseP [Alphaproteobacteria bacterium]|nr:RIP metalloprotease RseP [Alphaproteobacteria bacterium]
MVASLVANILGFLQVAVPFLFVLTVVVFIHELGHFLVARWCGVKVTTFSIGFGKEIFGFIDRHGTRWRMAWIPLGGYVKFMDDDNAASKPSSDALKTMTEKERAGSFHHKPLWQRAAVVAAGPIANFLLAILIFSIWFLVLGVRTLEPKVDQVLAGSAAETAGFASGDLIVAIDGEAIQSFEQVKQRVLTSGGRDMKFEVDRSQQRLSLTVVPELKVQKDIGGDEIKTYLIGIRPVVGAAATRVHKPGVFESVGLGCERTWMIVTTTLTYLSDVIIGRQPADQLGGPARIADLAGKVAKQSSIDLIFLTAFISVSVGLINLFPIPLLDGGHLMFYAIEALRRRPLSERSQEIGFRIGMAVVLSLMIFATFNDLPIIKRWIVGPG